MKFTKLAAAVSAVAVASAAFAVAASASYTTSEADGQTTEKWVFDEATYNDYITNNQSGYFGSKSVTFSNDCITIGSTPGNNNQTNVLDYSYVSFTAPYDGTLSAHVAIAKKNNRIGILPNGSTDIGAFKGDNAGDSTKKTTSTEVHISVEEGKTYYIASKGSSGYLYDVSYTYTTPVTTHSSMFEFKGDGTFTSIKATAQKGEKTNTQSIELDNTVTLGEGSSFYLTISDVPNDVEITEVTAE